VQRWEYCAIVLGEAQWWVAILSARAPGYSEIKIQQDKSKGDTSRQQALYRTIADLGSDGWEMVGEWVDPNIAQGKLIFFKRPLS